MQLKLTADKLMRCWSGGRKKLSQLAVYFRMSQEPL
jgi:hypothetical protein